MMDDQAMDLPASTGAAYEVKIIRWEGHVGQIGGKLNSMHDSLKYIELREPSDASSICFG